MFTPRHSTPPSIEAPELGQGPGIHAFAANGLASAGMLQATYLRFIEEEGSALLVQKQIPATHEKQGPSDQAKKPDGDPDFSAGDCCSMPPGAAAGFLITRCFERQYPFTHNAFTLIKKVKNHST